MAHVAELRDRQLGQVGEPVDRGKAGPRSCRAGKVSPSTPRISGTSSSAATKCISEVPGLLKHTSTPHPVSVRIRACAPLMPTSLSPSCTRPMPHMAGKYARPGERADLRPERANERMGR
jgi:hypothetical protein